MKKLTSILEFEKQNSNSVLVSNQLSLLSGGIGGYGQTDNITSGCTYPIDGETDCLYRKDGEFWNMEYNTDCD